ncbi:MAG: TusE/DsrC/DsvC family sulfur relay protein [Deltaproteobacteria bacterium]|nr:TusE/DsrC/DsvC family sulfur relay protein [Deltaproteobacteria bacterium]
MLTHEYAGNQLQLTDEGFLVSAADWTPEVAQSLAAEAGIVLTPEHWTVITYCREDAARQSGQSPGLRRISQYSGVGMKDLYRLFPKGPGKLAARIAGLPKPKACL